MANGLDKQVEAFFKQSVFQIDSRLRAEKIQKDTEMEARVETFGSKDNYAVLINTKSSGTEAKTIQIYTKGGVSDVKVAIELANKISAYLHERGNHYCPINLDHLPREDKVKLGISNPLA